MSSGTRATNGAPALTERWNDLFGDRLHVAFDIVVAAGPTEHHAARASVDVFPKPLAAILGTAVEHVPAGYLGEVLRVVFAERARGDFLGLFAIRIYRSEDEEPGPKRAHVAAGLAAERVDFRQALAQHFGRIHIGQP